MRSPKLQVAVILLGFVIGAFAENNAPDSSLPIEVIFLAFPLAILVAVIVLGFFAVVSSHKYVSYFYWFIHVASILGIGLGLGLAMQAFLAGSGDRTPYFTLAGAAGYLCGLQIVSKLYYSQNQQAHNPNTTN